MAKKYTKKAVTVPPKTAASSASDYRKKKHQTKVATLQAHIATLR